MKSLMFAERSTAERLVLNIITLKTLLKSFGYKKELKKLVLVLLLSKNA